MMHRTLNLFHNLKKPVAAALASITLFCGSVSAQAPQVAADILPIHSLVSTVMEGVGEPELILPPGASPHHAVLRPSQARAMAGADLVIWGGQSLSPWMGRQVRNLTSDVQQLELNAVPDTVLLPIRADHDHGGAGHESGHDHEDARVIDPHSWLDPNNALVWISAIAATLSEVDPENATTYQKNAVKGAKEIEAAAKYAKSRLQNATIYVVYHDAYHYLEKFADIPRPLIISQSDARPAGAGHLAEVRKEIVQRDAACLLAEPGFSNSLARRLVEGSRAKIIVADPVGAGLEPGPDLYPTLLRGLADTIADCFES